MNETRFQNFASSALEELPDPCAVKVTGLIADGTCFGSKGIKVVRNTGSGVSI